MTAVRILGWIHAVLGGLGLVVGTWACVGLMLDPDGAAALAYIGPIFMFTGTFYFAPAFFGGVGLLRGKAWGRWMVIALSFLLLLAIPLGTLLGGFGLWALLRPQGLPPATQPDPALAPAILPRAARGEARRIGGLAVAMVAVGAGLVIVLNVGFRVHGERPPAELNGAFYPAVLAMTALVVWGVVKRPFAGWGAAVRTLNPIARARWRGKAKREYEDWKAARALRIATLSADPGLRPYAERIAAGESWSDAQIAYDRDPDALATCRHLAPIERSMRRTGIVVKLLAPPQVRSHCRLDEAALWARFERGRTLSYTEKFLGGRSAEDDPVAYLMCDACQATIDMVHPRVAGPEIPVFPEAAQMTGG